MHKIISFFKENYWNILKVLVGLFLLYWVIFILTPKAGLSDTQKSQLDSLSSQIKILHQDNIKLESQVIEYNKKIDQVDNNINKIKGQKTIIKEYYHEKINNVDKLTIRELDSFFTNRYNY